MIYVEKYQAVLPLYLPNANLWSSKEKSPSYGDLSCWGQDVSNAEGSGQNQGKSIEVNAHWQWLLKFDYVL